MLLFAHVCTPLLHKVHVCTPLFNISMYPFIVHVCVPLYPLYCSWLYPPIVHACTPFFNMSALLYCTCLYPRGVICRLCNKDRDQGQKGIGVRYRSCSEIQYKGKYGLRHLFIYSNLSPSVPLYCTCLYPFIVHVCTPLLYMSAPLYCTWLYPFIVHACTPFPL